ncbi:hypothetical protein [Leptobacterium sp. I13]|uniref:hypothetical protein n=1 Tax=Leptobacterium meishanense TaxID=3128904 RepID=UPI0030EDE142
MQPPYKFVITHHQNVLDTIYDAVSSFPQVYNTYIESGDEYLDGETGPIWYALHVYCDETDSKHVKKFILKELEKHGFSKAIVFRETFS